MRDLEATLLIVGEGRLRPHLFDAAAAAGVLDRVVFVGEVADAERAAYYHAADVFVLPATSRAETFGIAMLEAMACGTPAVSTEVGTGTSWLNVDGTTGLVVPPGDPTALASALKRLLDDPDTRGEMGEAAAARVRESFTKKAMLDGLAEVYRSAV
jgi:rhamnosyl/mannosyltransferase